MSHLQFSHDFARGNGLKLQELELKIGLFIFDPPRPTTLPIPAILMDLI